MAIAQLSDPYEPVIDKVIEGPTCHPQSCKGYGNPDYGVMFIGIAPGKDEVRTGRPLTGPSGQLLNLILDGVGFPRSNVYCTNLICWWKDDPNAEEAARCSARLQAEIDLVKPKLIITLGGIVTEIFTGRKLFNTRGSCIWYPRHNAYVMPTYHPAAVLRSDDDPDFAINLWRDLAKIKDVLDWPQDDSRQHVKYTVLHSKKAAQEVLDNLPKLSTIDITTGEPIPVALDVETQSRDIDEIDVFIDDLLCLCVSTPYETWEFPRYVLDGLKWPQDVCWTFHYGLFDTQVMKRHLDVWLPIREDTLLKSATLDERPGYHRLKPLSREYLGAGFWEEERKTSASRMADVPPPLLWKYNAHDGRNTAALVPVLSKKQEADNVTGLYRNLLLPAINVYNRIQYRGVRVDRKLLNTLAVQWGLEIEFQEENLAYMANDIGWIGTINVRSTKQVSKLLYEVLALPLPENGKPSTDQKNLDRLAGLHPFVDALREYRHWEHMYGIYINALNDHIKPDGRVHATVKLHGTVTGRLAYTNPPLQTIPSVYNEQFAKWNDTFGKLRRLFLPEDDDSVIIEADYGKAEIWMAHYYSKDQQMLRDLMSGDYHRNVGAKVFNKPPEEVQPKERRDMKTVTFGVMYGREEKSLAAAIQRSVGDARKYIRGFFEVNVEYAQLYQDIKRRAVEDGELVTLTGRKRRFLFLGNSYDYRALKQAVNYPIQSTASDCTLSSVIELYPLLLEYDAHILISVHDSIVVSCPRRHVETVMRIIHDVMVKPRFPEVGVGSIPVEMKIGSSWGTTKEVHSCEWKDGCLYGGPGEWRLDSV